MHNGCDSLVTSPWHIAGAGVLCAVQEEKLPSPANAQLLPLCGLKSPGNSSEKIRGQFMVYSELMHVVINLNRTGLLLK